MGKDGEAAGCRLWVRLLQAGLLLLLGILVWGTCHDSSRRTYRPSKPEGPDAAAAWAVTKQFVKKQLKAPATAEFPCCYDDFTTDLGGGRLEIVSYVDSENSFGALVRTTFAGEVQWVEGDTYRLISLTFGE